MKKISFLFLFLFFSTASYAEEMSESREMADLYLYVVQKINEIDYQMLERNVPTEREFFILQGKIQAFMYIKNILDESHFLTEFIR